MNNEELKSRIGTNIVRLRKSSGMTQADLAERLNYSDKAVSKWERAESMPDILTLMLLAEQFGTDVNELLSDPEEKTEPQPEAPAQPEQSGQPKSAPAPKAKRVVDKTVIQKLTSLLVWIVALFVYLVLDAFQVRHAWMVFVLAVLANAITLLSLRSAWRLYGINRLLISIIMWTSLAFIYLCFWMIWSVNVWRIFLLGILGQAAIVLWFKIFQKQEEVPNE